MRDESQEHSAESMEIKRGPYGYFAAKKKEFNSEVFTYALELLQNERITEFLPVYLNDCTSGSEFLFDFSGLISIDEFSKRNLTHANKENSKNRQSRRISAGRLFLSILNGLDFLLSPENLCLDSTDIFTDSSGSIIRICYVPVQNENTDNLRLGSVDFEKAERLLSHTFFKQVLHDDEISAILFSIRENDEKYLKEICNSITGDKSAENKRLYEKPLFLSLVSAILSAVSLTVFGRITAYIFLLISVLLLIQKIRTNLANADAVGGRGSISSEKRKKYMFEDIADENTSVSYDNTLRIHMAFLESPHTVNGKPLHFAMYTDYAVIGSDRFVSDFYINDDTVSSIHAKITDDNGKYLLTDMSSDNTTFIDNRKLVFGRSYEIKDGQTIRIGSIDFSFNTKL